MTELNLATYVLSERGAIQNWLACGTVTSPLENLHESIKPDGTPFGAGNRWILNYWAWHPESNRIKLRIYNKLPPFTWEPGERPHLNAPAVAGQPWRYSAAEEDQAIDFSLFNFNPTLMQGWLYAGLQVDKAVTVQAELLTIGPARVWLNGKLQTHFKKRFSYVALQFIPLTLKLKPGMNDLCLHGEMLGWREARLALGLRFSGNPSVQVCLPLGDGLAEAWHQAENSLAHLQIKQFAFPNLPGKVSLDASAPESFTFTAEIGLPVPKTPWAMLNTLTLPKGEATITLAPGESAELPITPEVAESMSGIPGENTLTLTIRPADGTPLSLHREIWAAKNEYSHQPYGDYESRRHEALDHLANMPYDVPSALAALELRRIRHVPSEAIGLACEFMENRSDCADFYAIGLLALMYKHGDSDVIHSPDRERIETAFRNFKYWLDEPGLDAMCYFTENHQILFQVTAYLAGQRWPDWVFVNSGRTGQEQKERNRPCIGNWILRRLQGSFSEWDSNAYMTLDAFAMLALVEFADSARLREMATALLHKIFFMIACQSYRGTHGSTHGRCYVAGLKSARVENTSNLQRIGWGMGILNGETRATGLLALVKNYQVPEVIQRIGADVEQTVVTRARSFASFRPKFDMRGDSWDVRTITRKTPDTMLSAAIDYQPGEFGIQEHLWQATLSPEAVVFTTYPGNSQEHGNARPNFWSGSARLPRVGMVDKTVICLYRFEENVGLGFSHAYFPAAMFEEVKIEGQWVFARVGDGYIALWGDGELVLTETSRHAGQELRSRGGGHAWICHVGSGVEDGDFAEFRENVMRHTPQVEGLQVTWTTPENQQLVFGWEGQLMVGNSPQNWDDFPHYENSYTQTLIDDETMAIEHNGEILKLDLKHGRILNG